jgi:tetratricopeptide (TPR) repeat protein
MDAKDPMAHLALGQLHLQMKKTKEAKAEIGKAFDLDPKNPMVVRGWCEWLWAENDNARALKAAQDLSKSSPKHPMGPFLEAIALERDNKDRKAIEAYEEALKRDPNILDAHKNLAILCHTRNATYTDVERTKKSLEHYERYFALGGKDPKLEQLYKQFKGFMDAYMGGDKKKK